MAFFAENCQVFYLYINNDKITQMNNYILSILILIFIGCSTKEERLKKDFDQKHPYSYRTDDGYVLFFETEEKMNIYRDNEIEKKQKKDSLDYISTFNDTDSNINKAIRVLKKKFICKVGDPIFDRSGVTIPLSLKNKKNSLGLDYDIIDMLSKYDDMIFEDKYVTMDDIIAIRFRLIRSTFGVSDGYDYTLKLFPISENGINSILYISKRDKHINFNR
ncbi:MAG: hypothetical protein ACRCX4_04765 [Bacteroidales bacterium]